MAVAAVSIIALGSVAAPTRAAAAPGDAVCSALLPSEAACLGIDKLAGAAATECRALGLPDTDCALPLGPSVLSAATRSYLGSWIHRAVAFQYSLGDDQPLDRAQWLGTHNSFNSFAGGATPSHLDSNQQLSLSEQLDIDMRALELDTHWLPAANAAGGTVVVCHGLDYSQANAGCTSEPPLSSVLPELDAWLNAHPTQVILLYLDDNFGPAAAYAETVRDLDSGLRRPNGASLIFRPAHSAITPRGCADLPLRLTRDRVRAAGRQVVLVANCQSGWSSDVYGWDRDHVESGSTPAFRPFPHCDASYAASVYDDNLVRYYEDSTFVTAASDPSESPAEFEANALTADKVTSMIDCGVNLFGFDQILPDDGRLLASVWSWAPGQPDSHSGTCTIEAADGRWTLAGCTARRPAACATPDGRWVLSSSVTFSRAAAACRPRHAHFGLPKTGKSNAVLHALLAGRSAWLSHRVSG